MTLKNKEMRLNLVYVGEIFNELYLTKREKIKQT
jgi:hypothetical protein